LTIKHLHCIFQAEKSPFNDPFAACTPRNMQIFPPDRK
jgi:hypothetical protein